MWKGITLSANGTTATSEDIKSTGEAISSALSSGTCPIEIASTLHAFLALGMIKVVEGQTTSHTVDMLVEAIQASYPEQGAKEPLWGFYTELSKMQLIQSQVTAPAEEPMTAPLDLLTEELEMETQDISLPLTSSALQPTSTAIGKAIWGDSPVGTTWTQRLTAHFRPRRVVRIYKSYSVGLDITRHDSSLVTCFSRILDGFGDDSIQQLRSEVCGYHHVHPVTFFWAGLVACLTAPSLSYPSGAPRDLLELYDTVYGGDSRAPGLVTSLLTALSLVLYSLLGSSVDELLALEGAVVTTRPFAQYVPTDQLDTAASPSNPALCRMVIKLVESLFNNRLLFANPETGFVPMLSPSLSYAVFVDFHCRLDEVVIANRQYRSTKKEVVCRNYSIDPSVLVNALKTPASAFNSVTADHTGMTVEVVAEMTRQTALYAKETKVESCVPGSQNAHTSATNFDVPPPLPSGERFFKLTHPVPEPSWGDYFTDRFQCSDSNGRSISTCSLFIKTAPLLFVSELLYRGMWDWAARLVQRSMEGGGLYSSPLNLFLFPHRSLTQLSTAHLVLQLNAQSTPALRNETIHHSYVTAMVSNMHLDAASSQQIDWAPSSFVYSLQAQLVNMFERDVSNPIVKGLVKPLQQGTLQDAPTCIPQVLNASLCTLLRMIPLLRVCQSYFSAFHFPVISRVMSFLATMVRVEGIRNRQAFGSGAAPDWKWCIAASEAYVAFIAPSIRCTCAVSPSVALFDVLEELLDALSYPVLPLEVSTGRLSVSASQVRLHARLLVGALELPKVALSAEKWASFPLPRFVDSDLLCAPYDTSSTDGPGRRYPHDAVQTKEIAAIMNQSMRRVTSDNVHQYTLTLRKVLFSDPILFIRKLISLAIGNADSDLIFCQAQLLQGAPKAILRMFVVLAIDAMETHAEQERTGAEQRVGLIGALIAFVWAQNSNNFQECGRLLLRTVADILQREAKSSATFAVELLRSLLLHMLHEPLESEEQYNSQQLVALAALPISRWFAQNGADSFLQNKWFDPQTMLLKMKGAKKDSVAQADEAMAFSYMSSVNSSKSNLDASTESQFSYRNFIFAASFTPLTLDQCRLGFCEALGAALDPCVCDVSVGAVIIQRLSAWHARTYDWYSDLSGTVEDVMKVSARHTSCFLDLTLSLVQLSCIGKHAGAITQLPIVQLDMLSSGLPQVAARCRLVLQEFGAVETVPSGSLNDMFWQLSSPDASYPKSAYYYALQQVHRFLRQAITGHAGPAPTSKNEDKGLSIEEVATIEENALRDYLKEMADEEAKRRRQHFKDQLSARATEDKIEVVADNSDDDEASDGGAGTIKGMIMGATWLRIEQKVIARYLLDAKDAVVREATTHSARGTAPLTDLANKVVTEVLGDASLDRIIAFSHDALVPRVLLSSADGVVVGLLFRQLWEGLKNSVSSSASSTVTRLQQERAASRLMELLNTFVTELIVFLPSLTDAEAKRAGLALQRVLTLSREVAAVATLAPAAACTGVMASIVGKGTQPAFRNGLPLSMEAFLAQSFSQLLQECDMSNLTANAAQGSGYSLIVRNAFIILERIKLTLVEGSTAKPEALFPTAQPYVTTLSDSVRLHATKTSASYAAASSLAALYDSRVKAGDKRPRSGEAVDSWVA